MDPGKDAERIVDLETKIAFLEQTVDDLSDVVLAQGRTIEQLERRLRRLEQRGSDDPGGSDPGPGLSMPPFA